MLLNIPDELLSIAKLAAIRAEMATQARLDRAVSPRHAAYLADQIVQLQALADLLNREAPHAPFPVYPEDDRATDLGRNAGA